MMMMGTILDAITYVLVAFTAISLVVSSVMIGIITYVSVVERTKEIGVLRSLGARKKDVKNLFNAETFIEGLAAGLVGIGITNLLLIPINLLIQKGFELNATAVLTPMAALILVALSVLLTFIAGLIPSRSAAKKDPVVALRSE
jgi:putative ABC transport system permease protein